MSNEIQITDRFDIGENDHGYKFAVGKIGKRWVGIAGGSMRSRSITAQEIAGVIKRPAGFLVQEPKARKEAA